MRSGRLRSKRLPDIGISDVEDADLIVNVERWYVLKDRGEPYTKDNPLEITRRIADAVERAEDVILFTDHWET